MRGGFEGFAVGLDSVPDRPPGHWFTILNYVNDHSLFIKRFQGKGSILDELEWDNKRERIRVLVRRVEVGVEQSQVVCRVDAVPGESDTEKKACHFVGGVATEDSGVRR